MSSTFIYGSSAGASTMLCVLTGITMLLIGFTCGMRYKERKIMLTQANVSTVVVQEYKEPPIYEEVELTKTETVMTLQHNIAYEQVQIS